MIKLKKEFNKLIPPLQPEEYILLEESIKKEGCRDPILIWNDIIIDGNNRFEICNKYKIEYKTKEIKFNSENEATLWIINNQLARRNLTDIDKFLLNKKKFSVTETDTVSENVTGSLGRKPRKDFAEELGWSIGKVQEYDKAVKEFPEEIDNIRDGKIIVWNKKQMKDYKELLKV